MSIVVTISTSTIIVTLSLLCIMNYDHLLLSFLSLLLALAVISISISFDVTKCYFVKTNVEGLVSVSTEEASSRLLLVISLTLNGAKTKRKRRRRRERCFEFETRGHRATQEADETKKNFRRPWRLCSLERQEASVLSMGTCGTFSR